MSATPLARNAFIVGLGNVGSRVLGLVRELVIAGLFGATAPTDAFRVAFRVPLTLYELLVGGMISAALVPVFSAYLADGRQRELARLWGGLAGLFLLVVAGLIVMLSLLAGPLMALMAAGYEEPVRVQSAELLRVLLPVLAFMGLSGLATALLYARQQFGPPALAITMFNFGIILVALLFHEHTGVMSLALGVLAGGALQLAVQAGGVRGLGSWPTIALFHPGTREVVRLYLPVALGLAVSTVGILIDTNLASRTGEGSLAAMGFATTLVQLPLGLLAGVGSAALPVLSRHSGEAYRSSLVLSLRLVLLAIVPATIGLVLLRTPIIRLLFQRGAFDAVATQRTAQAFLAYSPGLPAAGLDQVLIQGYYARRQTLTPVLVGVVSVGVYLIVALALLGPMGMPGLALANSAQWTGHLAIMLFLTHRAIGGLGGHGLGQTAVHAVAATAAIGALLSWADVLMPAEPIQDTLPLALYVSALVGALVAIYLGILAVSAREDFRLLMSALRRQRVAQ